MARGDKRSLTVEVLGDAKGARRMFGQVGRDADGLGAKFGRLAGAAAKWGAAGVAGAIGVGQQVLQLGARFQDMDKKAATVFESQLPQVQKWAKGLHGAFGMTSRELVGMTANTADLLKPMGFAADQATVMAQRTSNLAGALAKWSGGTVDAAGASEILTKAYLGERDALTSLGIKIGEADVQARLAAKGQEKLTGQALEQAKAVATMELIYEKSTDAQKAWNEGQDDLSVRLNKAKATVLEFRDKAVEKLLPIVVTAVEKISEWGSALRTRLQPFLEKLTAWWAANGPAIMARVKELGETASHWFGMIATAIGELVEFATRIFGTFKSRLDDNQGKISEWRERITSIIRTVREAFAAFWEAVQAIFHAGITIVSAFWDRFGSHIVDFLIRTVGRVLQVVEGLFTFLKGIFQVITGILTGDWGKAWEGVKNIVSGAKDVITGVIGQLFDTIKTLLGGAVAAISQVWSGLWGGIRNVAVGALNWVIDALNKFLRFWNAIDFTVPELHVPGTNINVGGFTIGLPDIPELSRIAVPVDTNTGSGAGSGKIRAFAHGAVIDRPTVLTGLFAEAGEREFIAPESTLADVLDQVLARRLDRNAGDGAATAAVLEVLREIADAVKAPKELVNLDGERIADAIVGFERSVA